MNTLARKLVAEAIGTAILVSTIVGSGIMAAKLSGGNTAVALLGNTLPTGAILVVLVTLMGPISGAHFNPVVSLVFALQRAISWSTCTLYIVVQVAGGCAGTVLANLMFDLPAFQWSSTARSGTGQLLSEVVATLTLLGAIMGGLRFAPFAIPWLVSLTITAAYWFTASTSFANPAVTLARTLSDTFAGIAPASVLPFIGAQIVGALVGLLVWSWLFAEEKE